MSYKKAVAETLGLTLNELNEKTVDEVLTLVANLKDGKDIELFKKLLTDIK